MFRRMKRPAAAIMLLSVSACSSLQPVVQPPSAFFAKKPAPRFVVVTTTDATAHDQLVLMSPRLENGTIMGTVEGEPTEVPVARVQTMMATQHDKKKTAYAVGIGAVVVGGLGLLIANAGNGAASKYVNPSCGHQPQCYIPE